MHLAVYEFTAYDPHAQRTHHFAAYVLPTGEVLVPQEQTNDTFFDSLETVEAHGNDTIEGYTALDQTVTLSEDEVRAAIRGSAGEFGPEAIPASLQHWLPD